MTAVRKQRVYDHRLRLHVFGCDDDELAKRLDIPRSTMHGWKRRPLRPVVSHVEFDPRIDVLKNRARRLERKNARLWALLKLALLVLRWHVGITVIRLLNGSKVYLHGLIDNFSRRILAWKTSSTFAPSITAELLSAAAQDLPKSNSKSPAGDQTQVMVDGGVENLNGTVDAALAEYNLKRVLAQVDVTHSNSMIEAFWRSLKCNWLFLNTLDSLDAVTKHVAFYVQQHNEVIPHSAFKGQTPEEMYFQTGGEVENQLKQSRAAARQARMAANRSTACSACSSDTPVHTIKLPDPPPP